MKRKESIMFLLFLIISINKCIQPPKIESSNQIMPNTPELFNVYSGKNLLLKDSKKPGVNILIINSTATITYYDDYQSLEHQIILVPQNLQENKCSSGFIFNIFDLNEIKNSLTTKCKIINNSSNKSCQALFEKKSNTIAFSVYGNICKGDNIVINYNCDLQKISKEKLYKEEMVIIPIHIKIGYPLFCSYKYIIPKGYIFLGTKFNRLSLTKESETTYSYYGSCNKDLKIDIIRYSPENVSFKAQRNISLVYPPKFTDDVKITFPLPFIGGKIITNNYQIFDFEGREYQNGIYAESDYNSGKKYYIQTTFDDTEYISVIVPAANLKKVGVEINITFTNNLNADFKLDDSNYEIDLSLIDQEIIDKANEIIREKSDKPDYYKIGKFVNKYLSYDNSSDREKNLTLKEIYDRKKGKSYHFTLLYNAMLNSIGIKTFFINGWLISALNLEEKNGHIWTLALINGKWMELDATYGFFEGVSAAHIMYYFTNNIFSRYIFIEPLGKEKDEISSENLGSTTNFEVIEIIKPKKKGFSILKIFLLILLIIAIALIIVFSIIIYIYYEWRKNNYEHLNEEMENVH